MNPVVYWLLAMRAKGWKHSQIDWAEVRQAYDHCNEEIEVVRKRIEIQQDEYSKLWYWRIYGKEPDGYARTPLVVGNGQLTEEDCKTDLELVRSAFTEVKEN